jgi:hypothetical protein
MLGNAIETGTDDWSEDFRDGSFVGDLTAAGIRNTGAIIGGGIEVGGEVLQTIGDGASAVGEILGDVLDAGAEVVEDIWPGNWF